VALRNKNEGNCIMRRFIIRTLHIILSERSKMIEWAEQCSMHEKIERFLEKLNRYI
jgi:hypothetical protein